MTQLPPFSEEAEATVLSHILWTESRSAMDLVPFLLPEHFYLEKNRLVFEGLRKLDSDGVSIDCASLATLLNKTGDDKKVSIPYIVELHGREYTNPDGVITAARAVYDQWRTRRLIAQCQLTSVKLQQKADLKETMVEHERVFAEIAAGMQVEHAKLFRDIVGDKLQQIHDRESSGLSQGGTPTGFAGIDAKTGGLFEGDLVVVASRPGMGKSALALHLAHNVAKPRTGTPSAALVFSLEMPEDQVGMRILCGSAGVPVTVLREKVIPRDAWPKLTQSATDLSAMPLWVDDTPAISILELRARVRQLKRMIETSPPVPSGPLRLVVVDYLQLMRGERTRNGNREQEVASITKDLKLIAKEESVCVVALSQLNRAAEEKKDQRPSLRDLRESGAIEQDADAVWFLYRPSYYDSQANKSEVEVIVAKQRNGPTGTVSMAWKEETMRFYDAAYSIDTQDALNELDNDRFWD